MDLLKRCLVGELDTREIRRYLAVVSAVFWGLILVAWLSYPKENHYSIMTDTFSFLGSYETYHNPHWWWIFSIAMFFWGSATIPLVFYIRRRFVEISRWGAELGAFLMVAGCIGIILVALFPDGHGKITGTIESTHIHMKAAFTIAAGLGLGIIWHGLMLAYDWLTNHDSDFEHVKFLPPYALWASVVGTGLYFQIKWESVYAAMKAAAAVSGKAIGSHWSAAMNTRYSFPLWENLTIYALFIFLVWFTISLPEERY